MKTIKIKNSTEGIHMMAFFERPMWMHAWFPGYATEVIDACRQLNAVLEPALHG